MTECFMVPRSRSQCMRPLSLLSGISSHNLNKCEAATPSVRGPSRGTMSGSRQTPVKRRTGHAGRLRAALRMAVNVMREVLMSDDSRR